MKGNHWATIGLFLGAAALMVSGLHDWSEAIKPQFVAGVIAAAGATLKGMYEDKPSGGPQ